jgi:hypothetical protein
MTRYPVSRWLPLRPGVADPAGRRSEGEARLQLRERLAYQVEVVPTHSVLPSDAAR